MSNLEMVRFAIVLLGCSVAVLIFEPGKVTHLKVLLDLGDEVTVERYMVVPPAPKIIGAFNNRATSAIVSSSTIFVTITSVPYTASFQLLLNFASVNRSWGWCI
jgi:hypothetical protein